MIAVLIPTLNEEEAIESVIKGFPDEYRGHEIKVYVVDGGSEDRTLEIAENAGTEVIHQIRGGGKGNGVSQALKQVEADYYVMLDGDGTYDPAEMGKLMDPLLNGSAEHVIGRRSNRENGAIPLFNRIGNYVFNFVTRLTTGEKIYDMLSGYRAFTKESLAHTGFTQPGFGIETEMTFTAVENDLPIREVPISYSERKGNSKLHPLKDGWRIVNTIIWSIRDMNPLKFFSTISLLLLLVALYPAYLTVRQKLSTGLITDPGTAITAGVLVILAVQFMIFGLLADQIKNIEKRLTEKVE